MRNLIALLLAALLAGCAVPQGRPVASELDVSQLVQTAPRDLRVVDVLPRGIGTGGEAFLLVEVVDDNPEVQITEEFVLRLADERYDPEERRTIATYVLSNGDFEDFTQVQIRLRAQMLAGYHQLVIWPVTTICDEAGVAIMSDDPRRSPTLIQNARSGRTILSVVPGETLGAIKDRAPFCT